MAIQCLYNLGMITYFELNRDYIAEVLCIKKEQPMNACQGQCFLKKNFQVGLATSTSESSKPTAKERIEFPTFMVPNNQVEVNPSAQLVANRFFWGKRAASSASSTLFRPPRLVS